MERNRTPDDRLNINCKALLEVPPHAQFSHLHTNAGMHTQPHKAGVYLFVRSPCVRRIEGGLAVWHQAGLLARDSWEYGREGG